MKTRQIFPLLAFFGSVASAATIVNFDSGPDPSLYSFQQLGTPPGPSVPATGGNPNGFLQLSREFGSQHNFVPFNQTDPGLFPVSTFAFDFRIDRPGNGGADGFSFSYIDTGVFGTSGPLTGQPFSVAEDPSAGGVLGFGFDTWGNAPPNDYVDPNTGAEFAANYSEITAFYNGTIIARIDDTRLLPTPLNLKDSAWLRVTGVVDFQNARISMRIDGNVIFDNVDAQPAGLVPFESRLLFGARTGGASERVGIDNLEVFYIPEPASGTLLILAGCVFGCATRRRRV